ncbi:hypothetical protein PFMC_02989 [Plasmodium falciparum CAMP/Malaysia]|uniref:Transmembrane protein n=1 Tax=Plasmodium falciparum (isolate Camp / Malaysia) TaxID=5835 RepID=A0A024X8J0_PLAFC|nr:hypothetical protein PFMC_02989 [Plasmodium falciparum CAMP/Malaysia]
MHIFVYSLYIIQVIQFALFALPYILSRLLIYNYINKFFILLRSLNMETCISIFYFQLFLLKYLIISLILTTNNHMQLYDKKIKHNYYKAQI